MLPLKPGIPEVNQQTLEVGDIVARYVDITGVFARVGTVVAVSATNPGCTTRSIWFYSVRWDDTGAVEHNYMSNGLIHLKELKTREVQSR